MTTSSVLDSTTTAEQVASLYSSRIQGKTVLITGLGPDGISEAAVEALISAKVGTIFGTARTVSKAQAVFDRFKGTKTDLISIQMDNSDLASVRSAVKAIQSNKKTIDVIICSAGIMASPFQKTDDGIESQFQVCHLAHFLLVQGLRDTLSSDARVVSVTSMGHHAGPVRLDDYNFDDGKQYDPWLGYGQAKTANILFAKSLCKRNLPAYSVHPGVIRTGIMRHLSPEVEKQFGFTDESGNKLSKGNTIGGAFVTPQQGAAQYLYAAFSPELDDESNHGALIVECRVANDMVASHAKDETAAESLWRLSEELVGQK